MSTPAERRGRPGVVLGLELHRTVKHLVQAPEKEDPVDALGHVRSRVPASRIPLSAGRRGRCREPYTSLARGRHCFAGPTYDVRLSHWSHMMKIALDDRSLFGNDASEAELRPVFMSYFVDQPAFADFLNPANPLWIANGRKGMGKSALIVRFEELQRASTTEPRPIVVRTIPQNLVALKEPPQTEDHALVENYWKQVICGAINMALAKDMRFAWTDSQMALVETAEVAGFAGRNLVGALLSRLIGKVNVGGVLDLTPTPRPVQNHERLLHRIQQENGSHRPIWFLLDDIDAKYQNSPRQQLLISSLFSACRNLTETTSGIGIRATIRTDVWASLNSAEDMDKLEQYRTEITWSAAQQRQLLASRILAWMKRNDPSSEIAKSWNAVEHAVPLIELAFEEKMKWGKNKTAPTDHVLRVLAGGRPRWMAQLCRDAGLQAARDHKERIAIHHVNQAMVDFGRRRLSDLYKEHQFQFADMMSLVEAFAGGPRRYTTAELLVRISEHYVKVKDPAKIPPVNGVPYREPLQLARFLYKCGFINGNNTARASMAMPEFIGYDMRTDLLKVHTNLDDGMSWELLPAYRSNLRVE